MSINPADIKIILAENTKTMRKSGVKILNSLGYSNILEAADGIEAKKLLQHRKEVSLVISAWNMPSLSGNDLLTWMRTKSKKFRNTPLVMAISKADEPLDNKVTKETAATYLVAKPFKAEELQTIIVQALDCPKGTKISKTRKTAKKTTAKTCLGDKQLPVADPLPPGSVTDKKEQVSLSKLLFDKGIPTPAKINPEQLQTFAEEQARLTEENKKLLSELTDLKVKINAHENKATDLFTTGVQHLKDEMLFEAAACFNAMLIFEPDNIKALNNLAVIYFEMAMEDKAQECFENILIIEPDNELAQENLAALTND